jgi:hypothetical protein
LRAALAGHGSAKLAEQLPGAGGILSCSELLEDVKALASGDDSHLGFPGLRDYGPFQASAGCFKGNSEGCKTIGCALQASESAWYVSKHVPGQTLGVCGERLKVR